MNRLKVLSIYLISFFGFKVAQAQDTDLWQKYQSLFSDEAAVMLERSDLIVIEPNGDSLRVTEHHKEEILYLKDNGEGLAMNRIYGSHFEKVEKMQARTLVWEKSRYKKVAVSDFQKKKNQDNSIFYDDSHYYTFNFPSIASRNRTVLEYSTQIKDPRFISSFIFSSYIPQVLVKYTIKVHKSVEIHFEILNDEKKEISYNSYQKGDYIHHEWTGQNLPSLRADADSPSIKYYAPHLISRVKSYTTKAGKKNVLAELTDLHQWYNTFLKDLEEEGTEEMKNVVDKIVKENDSEEKIVKEIYYWVQQNIKYIAFEDGMRGFIPHSGSYVFEKRYGDCKDMASLLVSMLKLAGIKSYYTWIGTRDIPYRYSQTPTPLVDNHMIAAYLAENNEYVFLDATSDYTSFGFPSSMIQGKEAFVHKNANQYEVVEVPVVSKERNMAIDSIKISIHENEIIGEGYTYLLGYPKTFGGYELDRSDEQKIKKSVSSLVGRGNNKFYLDQYAVANLLDMDKPTTISFQFRIADYFQKIGDELYLNMNFKKDYYNDYINKSIRKTPKENEYQYTENEYYELTIPEGYVVSFLPTNESYQGDFLGYSLSYTQVGNKIIYEKKVYVDYLILYPKDFDTWNNSVKKISEAYRQSVILKKK